MKYLLRLLAVVSLLAAGVASATDVTITPASVLPGANAKTTLGTAGATITAGQFLYFDSTAQQWKLADANASETTAAVSGLAASGGAAGQQIIVVLYDDDLTVGGTLSTSAPVYVLSGTAGGIAPVADVTTGWYARPVLVAKSTTKAVFDPRGLRSSLTTTAP
jgi:hypothetical protein